MIDRQQQQRFYGQLISYFVDLAVSYQVSGVDWHIGDQLYWQ